MGTKVEDDVMDGSVMDFSMDELREFLEADLFGVEADPEFKEQLRQRLWALVSARTARRFRKEPLD